MPVDANAAWIGFPRRSRLDSPMRSSTQTRTLNSSWSRGETPLLPRGFRGLFFQHKMWDFFVKHLLGVGPPGPNAVGAGSCESKQCQRQ